jgi:signal transduction histidine kinase
MLDTKQKVIASITDARTELESALSDLEKLPAFDSSSIPFTAHALSSFLTVTEGTIELLRRALPPDADPELSRLLNGLRHATHLMMHSVSQLMNSSPVGDFRLRFEKMDLIRLVQRACAYYQRLALRKDIRVAVDATAEVPVVWSDRVAVASILDNLLSNAVKYSPPGKTITVSVRASDKKATCTVKDNGPGISAFDQNRLFQRGVRLSAQPTGGEASSGYGLAVAKDLVEQLGGAIWCESTLGKGAKFCFCLPILVDDEP